MRTAHERLARLLSQQEKINRQIVELQREILLKTGKHAPKPWKAGRLTRKRAQAAIQILLSEHPGGLDREQLFEKLWAEGWYPPTSEEFELFSKDEQKKICWKAITGSLTMQSRSHLIQVSAGGIIKLAKPRKG